MSTLTATQILSSYAALGQRRPRAGALGALLGRMADASRTRSSRRAMDAMSDHLLRDMGLVRGDLDRL